MPAAACRKRRRKVLPLAGKAAGAQDLFESLALPDVVGSLVRATAGLQNDFRHLRVQQVIDEDWSCGQRPLGESVLPKIIEPDFPCQAGDRRNRQDKQHVAHGSIFGIMAPGFMFRYGRGFLSRGAKPAQTMTWMDVRDVAKPLFCLSRGGPPE